MPLQRSSPCSMWPHITNAVLSGWRLRVSSVPSLEKIIGQRIHAVLEKGTVLSAADGGVDLMEALQHLEDELRMRAARPQG